MTISTSWDSKGSWLYTFAVSRRKLTIWPEYLYWWPWTWRISTNGCTLAINISSTCARGGKKKGTMLGSRWFSSLNKNGSSLCFFLSTLTQRAHTKSSFRCWPNYFPWHRSHIVISSRSKTTWNAWSSCQSSSWTAFYCKIYGLLRSIGGSGCPRRWAAASWNRRLPTEEYFVYLPLSK